MENRLLSHSELRDKIRAVNPLLVDAIDDVDTTLLDEFEKLSFEEKIEWASESRDALDSFSNNQRKP